VRRQASTATSLQPPARPRNPVWTEYNCFESNAHVFIGNEGYLMSLHRQRGLSDERGRLFDADPKGPTATRPAIFYRIAEMTAGSRHCDVMMRDRAARA
jgi:hypothetical protein